MFRYAAEAGEGEVGVGQVCLQGLWRGTASGTSAGSVVLTVDESGRFTGTLTIGFTQTVPPTPIEISIGGSFIHAGSNVNGHLSHAIDTRVEGELTLSQPGVNGSPHRLRGIMGAVDPLGTGGARDVITLDLSGGTDCDPQSNPEGGTGDVGDSGGTEEPVRPDYPADDDPGPTVPNQAPLIQSGPEASPRTARPGFAISFGVTATDVNHDALAYRWDFGDGSQGTGQVVGHAYEAEGVYVVTATVSDGVFEATGQLTVTISKAALNFPAENFKIKKMKLRVNWKRAGRDRGQVTAEMGSPFTQHYLQASNQGGAQLFLDVGGVAFSFQLGSKRLLSSDGKARIRLNRRKGVLVARFSKGFWREIWAASGPDAGVLNQAPVQGEPLGFVVRLLIRTAQGDRTWVGTQALR